jgi:hypothetical protein
MGTPFKRKTEGEKCSKKLDLVRIHLRTITRSGRGEKVEVLNSNEISNQRILFNSILKKTEEQNLLVI